jgi:hypothetical protein
MILLLVTIAVAIFLFYYIREKRCGLCPTCGVAEDSEKCPECSTKMMDLHSSIKDGCLRRLRGVMREDLTNPIHVLSFLSEGDHRMVVVTNVTPEDLVGGAHPDLTAVALTSSTVKGVKQYTIVKVKGKTTVKVTAPSDDFAKVFTGLEDVIRKDLGPHEDNLVLYIDEDAECITTPVEIEPQPQKESCCGGGRRLY